MSPVPETETGEPGDVMVAWTAGPRGWLTLFTMQQLIKVLVELADRRGKPLNSTEPASDVGQLVRLEIVRREWSDG